MLNCARCKSERKTKDGIVRGRQRYKCKGCGFRYTIEDRSLAKNLLKRSALELYLEGLGFRSIGRILKVSHVSIYNWIKSFGEKIEQVRVNSETPKVVEMDELHSYIGSKKTTAGYGLLLIDLGRSSFISSLDQGTLQPVKSCIRQ
jgi:transposase-like protein